MCTLPKKTYCLCVCPRHLDYLLVGRKESGRKENYTKENYANKLNDIGEVLTSIKFNL
jgi:hypothetical protein